MPESGMANVQKNLSVLLAGGGSGGHVYPLLAVVESLALLASARNVSLEVYHFGAIDEYTAAMKSAGVKTSWIMTGKLRRYFSLSNVLDAPKFLMGFFQVLFKMLFLMPDVIFSKGGPGALPVILVGRLYRIPIVIHESDAFPGLTNAVSSRFASRILTSFAQTSSYFDPKRTSLVGNPIRRKFLAKGMPSGEAKKTLGLDPLKPVILIIGGSRGSQRVNEFILSNLTDLLKEFQIFHQTGRANYAEVEKLSKLALTQPYTADVPRLNRYHATPYIEENLEVVFAAADLVVSRSGSGTIFEIAAFGKPAILIPLSESANDHQRANAYEFAKIGGARVIEEENLAPRIFINQIKEILGNPTILEEMKSASRGFFKPDAADNIAKEIMKLAGVPL